MSGRERLIAQVRSLRRSSVGAERPSEPTAQETSDLIRSLEDRVAHLEQLLVGLQDSVHRESLRHGKKLTELEARLDPAAMSKALSKDARERGL